MVCNDAIKNKKIELNDFLDKALTQCKQPHSKRSLQVSGEVMAVQRFENLHTFILRQPCFWARECPQLIFIIFCKIMFLITSYANDKPTWSHFLELLYDTDIKAGIKASYVPMFLCVAVLMYILPSKCKIL